MRELVFLLSWLLVVAVAPPARADREKTAGFVTRAARFEKKGKWRQAAKYRTLAAIYYEAITRPLYEYDIAYLKKKRTSKINAKSMQQEWDHHKKLLKNNDEKRRKAVTKAKLDAKGVTALEDEVRDYMKQALPGIMLKRNRQFGLSERDADGRAALVWYYREVAANYCRSEADALKDAKRDDAAYRKLADGYEKKAKKLETAEPAAGAGSEEDAREEAEKEDDDGKKEDVKKEPDTDNKGGTVQ